MNKEIKIFIIKNSTSNPNESSLNIKQEVSVDFHISVTYGSDTKLKPTTISVSVTRNSKGFGYLLSISMAYLGSPD